MSFDLTYSISRGSFDTVRMLSHYPESCISPSLARNSWQQSRSKTLWCRINPCCPLKIQTVILILSEMPLQNTPEIWAVFISDRIGIVYNLQQNTTIDKWKMMQDVFVFCFLYPPDGVCCLIQCLWLMWVWHKFLKNVYFCDSIEGLWNKCYQCEFGKEFQSGIPGKSGIFICMCLPMHNHRHPQLDVYMLEH